MFKRGKADKQENSNEDMQEEASAFSSDVADEDPTELNEFHSGDEEVEFPSPHSFEVDAEEVPTDDDSREEDTDLPFDEEDALDPDADDEEFLEGDADDFVDDAHEDYYEYGDRKHGVNDVVAPPAPAPAPAAVASAGGKHGRHTAPSRADKKARKKQEIEALPEHQRKSHRTRRVLIAIIILLVFILGGLGYLGYQLFTTSNSVLTQQANESATDVKSVSTAQTATKDASTANTKKTDVPGLVKFIGATQENAVKLLGHGSTVSLSADVNEEGNPVKKRVSVVLTDEPADAKSGTPTVYLGLNEEGLVIMAGYSAATASLGYGSLSFADAITNEHVIEKTLNEAGLNLPDDTVTLPARSTYSTYASDGMTLVKENCSFNGTTSVNGVNYNWSSVLVYDYTAANASGNLADTVRQIYVYVNAA